MRKVITCLWVVFMFAGPVAPVVWAAGPVLQLNLAAQPLAEALRALAAVSNTNIAFDPLLVQGLKAPAASGTVTAREALEKLLEGTRLQARFVDEKTVSVVAMGADAPAQSTQVAQVADLRLATASDENPVPGAGGMQKISSSSGEGTSADKKASAEKFDEEGSKGIPEILVKGKRSLNTDIERTEDAPQPYVVFDRAQIEHSMAGNLEDFLRTRLPMNAAASALSQAGVTGSSQSSIDLRGLGPNQTLILVDGRRMPNVNNGGSFNQPDINGIPLAAIERIEVLPSTASGIYGGGATGGVINVITRQDYTGMDVTVAYGNTFDTDVSNRRIDFSAGFSLQGGRTQVLVAASHADANPLLTGDRSFIERARTLQLTNNPAAFFSGSFPPWGATTNIRSSNGSNLILDDGTPLNAPRTFLSPGYMGYEVDGATTLLAHAGQYNLQEPDDLGGLQQSLLNNPAVNTVSLNLRRSFGARVESFVDFSSLSNSGHTRYAKFPIRATLPADARNNPFNTTIRVSYPKPGVSLPSDSKSETLRFSGGTIIRLPRDWTAAVEYVWSRSRTSRTFTTGFLGDPDGDGPILPVSIALSTGVLDVMRDLTLFPLDFSPYTAPTTFGPADTLMRDATARFSGTLLQLPAGALSVSAFVENRNEKAEAVFDDSFRGFPADTLALYIPQRSQTVNAYYLELRAPLISRANRRSLLQALELQASVRHDDYRTRSPSPSSDFVSSQSGPFPQPTYSTNRVQATKYTFALRYSPVQDVALRASLGTGFLPPGIDQIVPSGAFDTQEVLSDPKRSGEPDTVGPISETYGGNPDLLPEDSKSWSAGVVFTPHVLPGLRLSMDYTRIKKTAEISFPGFAQQVLDLEDYLPGRVTRAPLSEEDANMNYTAGEITAIDLTFVNFAKTRLTAYDVQADWDVSTDRAGSFHLYALATWQPHFERQAVPIAPFLDSVGFTGGTLEWRGNAGIDWSKGPWTLGWNTQYYDAYFVYAAGSDPATIVTAKLNQGAALVPRQMYHDLFLRYRIEEATGPLPHLLANMEVTAGIQNLLNASPPIIATTAARGGYSTYGDPRLRRYSLSIRKSFGN